MGTLFLKLGQLLSTRRDLVPPEIIAQLVQLQDKVKPFDADIAVAQIEHPKHGLGQSIDTLFARFDIKPLAAASIAQVHTAALHDGREVVVKVVRPDIRTVIVSDFELLRELASWASARIEAARAVHIIDIVEDYRQVMLNELDLTLEADNTTQMRNNFLGSALMYVPEVYDAAKNVMVMERIQGVPISQVEVFDQLGYDRAALAEKGLTIFFTQVFRDNFFMLICIRAMCLLRRHLSKHYMQIWQRLIWVISHAISGLIVPSWVPCQKMISLSWHVCYLQS
ncbi:hypothetical protein PKHYL_12380 [Psychrobacter sp. KH172YL61]|nr:hypothetical protein PKHYL_12380 [Psychrobacter sp. KH172YL61]